MTDREYLLVTNQVKVRSALVLLRDVFPGKNYGIEDSMLEDIIEKLDTAETYINRHLKVNGKQ